MKLQKHWFRNILIIICIFILGFLFVFALVPDVNGASTTRVTLENCQPQTWVGIVRWLNNKTDYEDIPDFELKYAGSVSMHLPVGEYGITHYQPRIIFQVGDKIVASPQKILEFRDVEVGDTAITFSFGCEE